MKSLAVAAGLWVIVASAVDAATRRGVDSEARVRFTLEARLLTVRLLPGTPVRVRRELFGRRIRATCGTDFVFPRAVEATSRSRASFAEAKVGLDRVPTSCFARWA